MAGLVIRICLGIYKSFKTARMSKAVGAEVATAATGTGLVAAASSASLLGAKEVDDDEFTPEEEEEAIGTNRFMAYCQTGISLIQLTVCSIKFKSNPLENGVTIGFVSVSIPLAFMGLSALNHPEAEYAVATMQIYQYYFILRVIVTCWDYSFEVRDRASYPNPKVHLAIATGILVAIICLQILNSLLVMAVIRILRKRRRQAVAREEASRQQKSPADEKTPLLGKSMAARSDTGMTKIDPSGDVESGIDNNQTAGGGGGVGKNNSGGLQQRRSTATSGSSGGGAAAGGGSQA